MQQEFRNQLVRLRQQFATSLPERAHRLEEIWSHLRHFNWSAQGIAALQQFAHKLIEASTSFGFPELRQAARQLENFIAELNELGRSFGGQEYTQLEDHIQHLIQIMANTANGNARQDPLPSSTNPPSYPEAKGKTLFLVDPDRVLAALCTAYLRTAGFTVEYFDNPQSCMQQLYLDSPAAILMDPDFEHSGLQALGSLHQIKALLTQETPIILMSGRTDVNAKLRALRAGSSDYLVKPLDFNFLVEKLVTIIGQHTKTQRVMIVDDDPAMTSLEEEILRFAGMEVLCVNQPLHSLQRAAKFKPDLVILDMHMPDINGMELAVLLRQDPDFLLLPIIFVTADTDTNLHKSIKALGVNALLTKPFEVTELISVCEQALADTSALKNRVARITRYTQQPQQINRSYFFTALEDELQNNSLGNQNSALYYFSIDKLEELTHTLGTVELLDLHDQFCRRLNETVGSDEQWMSLSTMVTCVLAGKRSLELHHQRGEQLIKHLSAQAYSVKGKSLDLQIKVGIAPLHAALGTANNALFRAEQAFDASINGTNNTSDRIKTGAIQISPVQNIIVPNSPLQNTTLQDKSLPNLSNIVLSRDLSLAFQPIISLEEAQIEHFSVLTRLRNENGEPIAAGKFLNRLTQPGKRLELDRWVLQQAVSAIAENSKTREQATLFIHLAEETLQQSAFFSFAANVLRSSRLRGEQRLIFMLEESWIINHFHQTREIAKALRDIRCSICITRAGENTQMLPLLADLQLSYLRLSPKLTDDNSDPKILEHLIAAVAGRDIKVIATQIENSHNLSSLWMQGVRLFEGFFIQPPDTGFHLQNDIIFAKELVQGNSFGSS
jgi:DNA-binding response OmpR family regulator/EAL domain-containing protein (putative c-di-GMP-specific phosphodiesterase class I)/HPt (histidine-containing phosphotransfer) domain-containing protein